MTRMIMLLRRVDWVLFLSVGTLTGLGALAVWTVDLARDPGELNNFYKQLLFSGVGLLLVLTVAMMDYRVFRSLARVWYLGGLALLTSVLFLGVTIRGTQGWFALGSLTWQPVELAKICLILALSKYFSVRAHIVDLKVMLGAGFIGGLYIALTMLQPDFGSALVLIAITSGMVLLTNVPSRYILAGLLLIAVLAGLGWNFGFRDYQKARLESFFNPTADPFGRGYNIRQSVIAVGAGGFFGRGLGEGSQSQLRFLPETQTDFIFAVLAEQLGFLGILLIFAAYGMMVWRLWLILKSTRDGFALFVVGGFAWMLVVQTVLNIGMNLGVLPVVGLPLPFVSLGGSAMLANFLILGIVQSIRVRG